MRPNPTHFRRFLWTVLAAPIFLIGAVEIVLRASVIPEELNAYLVEQVYVSKLANAAFGDSHFRNAFRQETPGFLNMSAGGTNARMMAVMVREFFRYRDPNQVIMMASPQLFSEARISDNLHGLEDFFRQNALPLPFRLYFFEPGIARHLSRDKHYFDLTDLARLTTEAVPEDDSTMDGPAKKEDWSRKSVASRKKATLRRVERQRPVAGFESTADYRAYESALAFLAARAAKVCLLKTPLTAAYLEAVERDERYLAADAAFRQLAKTHGARYVDFRDLPMKFSDSIFRNQDHLNQYGSQLFRPLVVQSCFGSGAAVAAPTLP